MSIKMEFCTSTEISVLHGFMGDGNLEYGASSELHPRIHEGKSEYFSWIKGSSEEEVFPLFGAEGREIQSLAPVSEVVLEEKKEDTSCSQSQADFDDHCFDPDAFLHDYLNSPDGQAILDSPEAEISCDLLDFPVSPLQNVEEALIQVSPGPLPIDIMVTAASPSPQVSELTHLIPVDLQSLDFLSSEAAFKDYLIVPSPIEEDSCSSPNFNSMSTSGVSSPEDSMEYDSEGADISVSSDEDPEWVPSPGSGKDESIRICSSGRVAKGERKRGRKSKRSPEEKKERKKAQNRNAAIKYREKRRQKMVQVDRELDQLKQLNIRLTTKVETAKEDLKYFKKLMIQVLGPRFAAAP